MIQEYLLDQCQLRSSNASNKDRKNLLAMWNWGKKIMGLKNNPVAPTDPFPHDVAPQDTYIEDEILSLLLAANRKNQLILLMFRNCCQTEWNFHPHSSRYQYRASTSQALDQKNERWLPWRWVVANIKTSGWWIEMVVWLKASQKEHMVIPKSQNRKTLCRSPQMAFPFIHQGRSQKFGLSCLPQVCGQYSWRQTQSQPQINSKAAPTQERNDHRKISLSNPFRLKRHGRNGCTRRISQR